MLTYLVVGAGYRAAFYGRIARRYPALFRAVYLCRSEEKAALMRARTGAEAVTSVAAAEATRPDFVVVAVNKASIAAVTLDWARRGWPVLAETPAGATAADLALLREEYGRGARIAVSEQYCRYPIIAAGLRAVCAGRLGETQTAYLSLCHDYHAASLL
ncbi:MAG: Gfo/Idh/MocA family oxidoreductase, partial [Oscillospiraceae bacterium]|nr:Gfo/Idh/MocA family oxidoreductase [Oscillospiraceae bacterium]